MSAHHNPQNCLAHYQVVCMQAKVLYLHKFAPTVHVGAVHDYLLEYMQAVPHASSDQQLHPIHMRSCASTHTQTRASSSRKSNVLFCAQSEAQ